LDVLGDQHGVMKDPDKVPHGGIDRFPVSTIGTR
jgi:hypothetical protein